MTGKKQKIFLVLAGLGVGFLDGFFGGGGGMLAVPALTASGLEEKKAHATAIAVILPISVASIVMYFLGVEVNFETLLPAAGGVIFGGVAGAFILKKLKGQWLTYIFYAVMLVAGVRMCM